MGRRDRRFGKSRAGRKPLKPENRILEPACKLIVTPVKRLSDEKSSGHGLAADWNRDRFRAVMSRMIP